MSAGESIITKGQNHYFRSFKIWSQGGSLVRMKLPDLELHYFLHFFLLSLEPTFPKEAFPRVRQWVSVRSLSSSTPRIHSARFILGMTQLVNEWVQVGSMAIDDSGDITLKKKLREDYLSTSCRDSSYWSCGILSESAWLEIYPTGKTFVLSYFILSRRDFSFKNSHYLVSFCIFLSLKSV